MPIYEYVCQKCGEHFEVNQKITDEPLKTHSGSSDCGGPVKKIISMNAFHLKGTGWYKTDYAKSGSSSTSPSKSSPETKTPSADSTSAESTSKPATTSTTDKSE